MPDLPIRRPRRTPPYRLFWCWDITYQCDISCSYCIVDRSRPHRTFTVQELETAWDRIFSLYGSSHIRFSGGEPFTYPGFDGILRLLGRKNTLNITTNLMFDIEKFLPVLKGIEKNSGLVISASFHPEFGKLEEFTERVLTLKRAGVYASATIVGWPPSFGALLEQFDSLMREKGIEHAVIPLAGTHFGREYPAAYTAQEKQLLEKLSVRPEHPANSRMFEFKVGAGDRNTPEALCRMGQNFGLIRPDGSVFRCCTFEKEAYIGNITDPEFSLYEEPRRCSIAPCTCYKAMRCGRENDYCANWSWRKNPEGAYHEPE